MIKYLSYVFVLLLLAGCSNDIRIDSFTVEGTTADINGVAQVNYGQEFRVSWEVTRTSEKVTTKPIGYSVELFLSEDDALSTQNDIVIYDEADCGRPESPDNCNEREGGTVNCIFTSPDDTQIECKNDDTKVSGDVLDALVAGGAFMIFRACYEGDKENCATEKEKLRLN